MALSSMFHTLSQRLAGAEAYLCDPRSIDMCGRFTYASMRKPEVDT
jgi:hypothetical protein